jgi:adenylate kinase family enzyme
MILFCMSPLIALAGHPASGKTTLATELSERYSFERISGSEILKRSAADLDEQDRPILKTRSDFDAYHRQWRKKHGIDAMGAYILRLLDLEPSKRICFENLRNQHDALRLRMAGGLIVALQCSFEERFARAVIRKPDAGLRPENFLREEEAEYDSPDPFGSHVMKAMEQADITLDSSHPLERIMQDLIDALKIRGILL